MRSTWTPTRRFSGYCGTPRADGHQVRLRHCSVRAPAPCLSMAMPLRACALPVSALGDAEVTTIEGVAGPEADAVRRAWAARDVPQCGYCQSGQVMSAVALLNEVKKPTDRDIDLAMHGNICRCATYVRIRAAIQDAADAGGLRHDDTHQAQRRAVLKGSRSRHRLCLPGVGARTSGGQGGHPSGRSLYPTSSRPNAFVRVGTDSTVHGPGQDIESARERSPASPLWWRTSWTRTGPRSRMQHAPSNRGALQESYARRSEHWRLHLDRQFLRADAQGRRGCARRAGAGRGAKIGACPSRRVKVDTACCVMPPRGGRAGSAQFAQAAVACAVPPDRR